ncbi:hypothetical protein ACFQYP_62840 [Nonomuraea antimicrobica]
MLTETLQRVADGRGGVLGVEPGLVIEPDASWTPVTELVREPYALLGRLIDETAARWNAPATSELRCSGRRTDTGTPCRWRSAGRWTGGCRSCAWPTRTSRSRPPE